MGSNFRVRPVADQTAIVAAREIHRAAPPPVMGSGVGAFLDKRLRGIRERPALPLR